MTIREQLEADEDKVLSPFAQKSCLSRGRDRQEPADATRPIFQHDRDRILHSKAFRRLAGKTQVFLAPAGDHYRTRLTHTLEVSQIARTIARALRLNESLTEAIAMGHDLGHTPFGHAGERALAKLVPGGFHHGQQSVRVVEVLEHDGMGLNLSVEVRDGILKHSKGKGPIVSDNPELSAVTLEGQIARIADIAAYVNHDLDDAIRGHILSERDLPAEVVDEAGAVLVGTDVQLGQGSVQVKETGDPYQNLAEAALSLPHELPLEERAQNPEEIRTTHAKARGLMITS